MTCCQLRNEETGRFFSWFARLSGRHYRRRGLSKHQLQLLLEIERLGVDGAAVLDIGCGVGFVHQELLGRGAGTAVGVDLSAQMLEVAQHSATERKLAERTRYVQGDFVAIADQLDIADITVMDKVVCCYPDALGLLRACADRTGRVLALTFPRLTWYNRLGTTLESAVLWLARTEFRSFLHAPEDIERSITASGFTKRAQHQSPVWVTQVYSR